MIMSVFAVELMDSASADNSADRCAHVDRTVDEDDMRLRHGAAAAAADQSTQRPSPCVLSPRWRVLLASALAAIGGVLFGYDTGVASSHHDN